MQTQVLTISDVAATLKVSTKTIRRWWYSGEIPQPIKIGRSLRWRQSDIEAIVAPQTETQKELT